jgi:hypothetical protein
MTIPLVIDDNHIECSIMIGCRALMQSVYLSHIISSEVSDIVTLVSILLIKYDSKLEVHTLIKDIFC